MNGLVIPTRYQSQRTPSPTSSVANYAALQSIDPEAWKIVTASQGIVTSAEDDAVTEIVTGVTFTEGLLRNILDLTADQQLELCKKLAHHPKTVKTV